MMREKQAPKEEPTETETPPFTDALPSTVSDIFWVRVNREVGDYPRSTERCGKWMVFIPNDRHDEVWARIRQATRDGLLGGSAKASTARPNPHRTDEETRAIMVYTYDGDDEADVRRVREALRELGMTQTLYWKADATTLQGIYSEGGRRRVWRYRD